MASRSSRHYYRASLCIDAILCAPISGWRQGHEERREEAEQLERGFANARAEYWFWQGVATTHVFIAAYLLLCTATASFFFDLDQDTRDGVAGTLMIVGLGLAVGA